MLYWMFFLSLALVVAGFLAFGGSALESRDAARATFFVLALALVCTLLFAAFRGRGSSKRPRGPRRP